VKETESSPILIREKFKIDKILQADIDQILQISSESNLSFWSKGDYLCEIRRLNSYIKVARLEKKVLGFIAARFNIEQASDLEKKYSTAVAAEADILNIGVLKSFQKQGIGRLLLEGLISKAEKLKAQNIWLEVRESNVNARTFYRRNGFVEIQKRRNFYSNPIEDAVLMRLDVNKYTKKLKSKT
jgi:ribosomal-protein-alanine N-acetyltransferase